MSTSDANSKYADAVKQYKLGKIDQQTLLDAANTMRSSFGMQPLTSIDDLSEIRASPMPIASTLPSAPKTRTFISTTLPILVLATLGILFLLGVGKSILNSTGIGANAAPAPDIDFADIVINNANMTGVQWRQYTQSVQGRHASKWIGLIRDVSDSGGYEVSVDLNVGEVLPGIYEAHFYTNKTTAMTLKKNQLVGISGTIDTVTDFLGIQFNLKNVTIDLNPALPTPSAK